MSIKKAPVRSREPRDLIILKPANDSSCPTTEQLVEFVLGIGVKGSNTVVVGHIGGCDRCRSQLRTIRKAFDRGFEAASKGAMDEIESAPR